VSNGERELFFSKKKLFFQKEEKREITTEPSLAIKRFFEANFFEVDLFEVDLFKVD